MPHMQTGIAWLVVKAGVGRRDSNAIGCGFPRIESENFLAGMSLGRGKGGGKASGKGVIVPPRESQFPGRSAGPQISSAPQATEGQEN